MSLIDEALRRVREPLPTPKSPPPSAAGTSHAPQASPAHSWPTSSPTTDPSVHLPSRQPMLLPAVALAVLMLTAGLIVGGVFWLRRTMGASSAQFPVGAPGTVLRPHTQPTDARVASSSPLHTQEGLVLSGVVEGLGDPYAVINGEIVIPGERIGEASLISIADGTATVRFDDGREVVLRVPR